MHWSVCCARWMAPSCSEVYACIQCHHRYVRYTIYSIIILYSSGSPVNMFGSREYYRSSIRIIRSKRTSQAKYIDSWNANSFLMNYFLGELSTLPEFLIPLYVDSLRRNTNPNCHGNLLLYALLIYIDFHITSFIIFRRCWYSTYKTNW